MLVVGLTGGIGSGKSTVAALLADRGAVVIDADRVSREVVEPGTDALAEIVGAFGDEVLSADGSLDRAAMARIVFNDDEARTRLESIIHPRVGASILERVTAHRDTDAVVVLDVPLMAESRSGSASLAEVIVVVDAPDGVRLDRLERRGMDRDDARARMAAQASREERLALADHVVDNGGDLDALRAAVDELWTALERRRTPA